MNKLFGFVLVAVTLHPGQTFAADTPIAEVSQLLENLWTQLSAP